MSFLGFLHSYNTGGLLKSSDWDDELNQILATLGSGVVTNPNASLLLSGSTEFVTEAILKLESLGLGDLLECSNNVISTLIKNNGQLVLGANGIVGLIIASRVKCPNLNADMLLDVHGTSFETDLYSFHSFGVFYTEVELISDAQKEIFVANSSGIIITKLKAQQPEVASVDAISSFDIKRNDVVLGTVTINGNTTAVQTNDIGDIALNSGDRIHFEINTWSGTTKHKNITVAIHYKNRYNA